MSVHHRGIAGLLPTVCIAACGGGGGEPIVLNPGDGLPVESFQGTDVADLDGDGLLDIVAISSHFDGAGAIEHRLNVFLQDRQAPRFFRPRSTLLYDEKIESFGGLTLVDLRLAGLVDAVGDPFSGAGFFVFRQDPVSPGNFLPPEQTLPSLPAGQADLGAMTIDDIDGDLYPDVVAVSGDSVVLYRQDSGQPGTILAGSVVAEGFQAARTADLSGDGLPDLLTFRRHRRENRPDSGRTLLYHVQDASIPGTFFTTDEIFFDMTGWDFAGADVDLDGRMDIVLSANADGDDVVVVYRQLGAGGFVEADRIPVTGNGIGPRLSVGDLDGDGTPEIVLGHRTAAVDANELEILRRGPDGNFRTTDLLIIPDDLAIDHPELFAVRIADVDANGRPDILVSTGELFIFFQADTGGFGSAIRIAGQR